MAGPQCPALTPTPFRIYLHSYGGAGGTVRSWSRMKKWGDRFYFGFSHAVNSRSPKTPKAIAEVLADRLPPQSRHPCQEAALFAPHRPTVPLACHPTHLSPGQVPTNRLLLESDREQSGCVEEDLEKMLLVMGDAKGLLGDEILHVTTANALKFYGYEGGESAADRW